MEFSYLFPLHWAAWTVATNPVHSIIATTSPQVQEEIINQWKKATLSTLTGVIYIGTILSAVTVGSFTWPQLEHGTSAAFSMIQTLWYSSLIFSVTAVCIGLCQCVFLARISCTTNCNLILRSLLIQDYGNRKQRPRLTQTFIWLLAVGMLEWSIYLWLSGFLVFLWEVTRMMMAEQTSGDTVVSYSLSTLRV
ncbi:hypothetical protein NX059_002825 [Plenodomus lindquistii]|nr:hypothetical protein NX059_002825 [Plenodomus lindquistii]